MKFNFTKEWCENALKYEVDDNYDPPLKTWGSRNHIRWMINVCEANDVFYLVKHGKKATWVKSEHMNNCNNVICFKTKVEAIKFFVKTHLPKSKKLETVEFCCVVPAYNEEANGKFNLWYDVIDYNTDKIENLRLK